MEMLLIAVIYLTIGCLLVLTREKSYYPVQATLYIFLWPVLIWDVFD